MNRRTFDKLRRIYVDRALAEIDNAMANSFLPPPPVIPWRVSTEMLVDAVRVGSERERRIEGSPFHSQVHSKSLKHPVCGHVSLVEMTASQVLSSFWV